MKDIRVVSNPLIEHYVGVIRDVGTCKNEFGRSIENIVYLMSKDITSHIGTEKRVVSSPLAETEVAYFSDKILVIPILRAGMSMLEPLKRVIPMADFGYVGIRRTRVDDEFVPDVYYRHLPSNLSDYKVYILEVVVATGSSVNYAINDLLQAGVPEGNISLISIISSKIGLDRMQKKYPQVSIFTCAIDEILTDKGMIVPGLGDAGNRYNGYDG
jgi:uracil phosphoribosyltransferase